jgi:hypothetical protein
MKRISLFLLGSSIGFLIGSIALRISYSAQFESTLESFKRNWLMLILMSLAMGIFFIIVEYIIILKKNSEKKLPYKNNIKIHYFSISFNVILLLFIYLYGPISLFYLISIVLILIYVVSFWVNSR